jgi:hypothetical protein
MTQVLSFSASWAVPACNVRAPTGEALQVGRLEAGASLEADAVCTALRLGGHRVADVRRFDNAALDGKRNGQRANSTASIAEGLSLGSRAVVIDPLENLAQKRTPQN